MSEFASSSQWMEKFQVGILGFYQTIKLYIYSMIIFFFRFHCILFFHSTRYAEEIKRTNLVGEINSQEGSWELKQHTNMIWDDNIVKSLVINGHTTCTAIFLYLFTSIYAMWMDTWCGSTSATKSCILNLMETTLSGGPYMKRLGDRSGRGEGGNKLDFQTSYPLLKISLKGE